MSKAPRAILTPGEPGAADAADGVAIGADDLQALVQKLQAENAALKAGSKTAQASVVYEPKTPHGQARLAASEYAGMTVAELVHAIDTGAASELAPSTNALCIDGYYCSRARIAA